MLTIDELLDQKEFELDLVAGAPPRDREVAGAHVIEVANPAQYLPENWVVLTTGLRLQDRPDEQRRMVRQLKAGGLTALGFGRAVVFDELPEPLLEEADRCDFPVFEVPFETPFRDIIRFVEGSLYSDDLNVLRRTVSMQRWLMDALVAQHPERELVHRLRSLLDSEVLLFGPAGESEMGGGSATGRSEEIWAALQSDVSDAGRPDGSRRIAFGGAVYGSVISEHVFEVDGQPHMAVPIVAQDEVRYWLVAAAADSRYGRQLGTQLLECARSLLQTVAVAHAAASRERRSVRLQVLHDLIDGPASGSVALGHRVATFGLNFANPGQVLLFEPANPREKDRIRWLEGAERLVDRRLTLDHVPHITGPRNGALVAVAQPSGELAIEALLDELDAWGHTTHCGVSGPLTGVEHGSRCFADAEIALRQAHRQAEDGEPAARLMRFDQLDMADWLLGQVAVAEVAEKGAAIVEALPDRTELRETLTAFFALDLDVIRTASELNLHPNSLRYRLRKIEGLLGRRLSRPSDIASLYLALVSYQLSSSSEPSASHASID